MNDKERILTEIISRTATMSPGVALYTAPKSEVVHWEFVHDDTVLLKGDIVLGITNSSHRFGISFFERRIGKSDLIVKEIGSNDTSEYTNEVFYVLRNLPKSIKLCGEQRVLRGKVLKACNQLYRFALVEIEFEHKKIVITVRQKFVHKEITFDFPYTSSLPKITIKSLLVAIKNATGYEG